MKIELEPIGIIHSPFTDLEKMPVQPKGAADIEGTIEVNPAYSAGIKDLEGFNHIFLIYFFHKAEKTSLTVIPFLDTVERGVFSTRSPLRPNHIGISIVQLVNIKDNVISVKGIDVLDGTPLLDVKPYVENFDSVKSSLSGWMKASEDEVARMRSDDRFK
jgi:tRNA (adenine37-N6)-methyltransferase